jgi:hypothetical protein
MGDECPMLIIAEIMVLNPHAQSILADQSVPVFRQNPLGG